MTREQIFVIEREGYEKLVMSHVGLTPDGKYFVSTAKNMRKSDFIRHPSVWDIHKRKFTHDLPYQTTQTLYH